MAKTRVDKVEDKKKKMQGLKDQMAKLETKLAEDNEAIERERIESLVCVNDEADLQISPEIVDELMTLGTSSREIVCPTCEMINTIIVRFDEPPSVGTAQIVQEEKGFFYLVKRIADLDDKQIEKRVNFLINEFSQDHIRLTEEMQLLLRMYQIFNKGK